MSNLSEKDTSGSKDRLMQIGRALWVAVIVIGLFVALYFTIPLIYPFIIGWLIAYMINPLANVLQERAKFPRWLATTVGLIIFFGILVLFLTLFINKIIIELGKLFTIIDNNIEIWIDRVMSIFRSDQLQDTLNRMMEYYNENTHVQSTVDDFGTTLTDKVSEWVRVFLEATLNFLFALPSLTFTIIIAILAAFLISKDWANLKQRGKRLVPKRMSGSVKRVLQDLQKATFGYLKAQFIMISITAVFITVGLLILDVDYAISIGLFVGFVDLLPYLGSGAVMVPWIIYVFVQGDIPLGIGLSVLYGIVFVTRTLVEPKVLASSIGMNALATLVAMVIGLNLFGAFGLLIGPVTLVIIMTLHRANVFIAIKDYIVKG